MPNPFHGMNPYLENPELWPEVHHLLIGIIAESLNPQLLPKYRVAVEKRVYQMSGEEALLVGIPDVTVSRSSSAKVTPSNSSNVAVAATIASPVTVNVPMPIECREGYLEVRETTTKEVVTVIEILSPANKITGKGRDTYIDKRETILGSRTHLVEIDLLRQGKQMPILHKGEPSRYRILISRSDRRPRADLYGFNLPDAIPAFSLPLRPEDRLPVLDLQMLLDRVYDRAGYDVAIDYSSNPVSSLSEEEINWIDAQLQEKGLR